MSDDHLPKIILPFQKFDPSIPCQDIVFYLRPETNGILVESAIFRVLKTDVWQNSIKLVFLANLPGEFIMKNRIVEKHYASRLDFAARGRAAFTPDMKATFERFFGIPFEKAKIYGAFEALQILQISADQLFQLWVPVYDILEIEGQLVKRTSDNLFIVNYDIPALLHKNHAGTDVAVMVFRTHLSYEEFRPVVGEIRESLIKERILDPSKTEGRVFHFSKGPFEQLLDAQGYVYHDSRNVVKLDENPFGHYLLSHEVEESEILEALSRPIRRFRLPDGTIKEKNIFSYTLYDTFEAALEKWKNKREVWTNRSF